MAWLTGWDHRREVTVDNTAGSAKTNYAVKIELTNLNFDFTQAQTNGEDVRLADADETTLIDHWIQSWDSVGETAVVWAEVPSILGASSKSIYLYYGNVGAVDASSIADTFSFGDDFTDPTSYLGTIATPRPNNTFVLFDKSASEVVTNQAGTWKTEVREPGPVLYDPGEADPNRRYKFYFSGNNGSAFGIGVVFSPDGETWTEFGSNPVIASGAEDPYVIKVGSTYHMWTEEKGVATPGINHYTSTDGVTWTPDGANPVLASGGVGEWDENFAQSPTVLHDGSTFYMLYEGQNVPITQEAVGLATSADGSSWVKSVNNPIIVPPGTGWQGNSLIPDDVIEIAGTWYLIVHAALGGSGAGVYTTTDAPAAWDDLSFTELAAVNPLSTSLRISSLTHAPQFFHGDGQAGSNLIIPLLNAAADPIWKFSLLGNKWTGNWHSTFGMDPLAHGIGVANDQMVLAGPSTSSSVRWVLTPTAAAGTSDFAVGFRRKVDPAGSDPSSRFTFVSLGAGTPFNPFNEQVFHPNGYANHVRDFAANGNWLRRITASVITTINTETMTAAEHETFAVYEFRYRATGALSYLRDGVQLLAATDSTHVALAKEVLLAQGRTAAAGGPAYHDWVYVRPYDGVDTTQTVGAEESDFDPANLVAVAVGSDVTLTWDPSW